MGKLQGNIMSAAVFERPVETMASAVGTAFRSQPLPTTSNGDKERTTLIREWLKGFYASQFVELKKIYQIHQEERVFAYLTHYSYLLPILHEGRAVIASIQTDLPVDEAVDRLVEFSDAWLGERLAIIGEQLTVMI